MDFKDYKINEFIEDLSKDLSSPGGGSTAALVAALASGLNSMVYSFTVGKKVFDTLSDDIKKEMIRFQQASKEFSNMSLEFMEKDRSSFVKLMDSYKLPKNTEDEKQHRANVIKSNTIEAMEVPLKLARVSLEFYDNIDFAIKYGNKNLISDGIVAATLLHSAIESAIVNVEINYNSLPDKTEYENIPVECSDIIKESLQRKINICNNFSFLNQ
jgi:formiminotetrahydrofolate cyclodeaminase